MLGCSVSKRLALPQMQSQFWVEMWSRKKTTKSPKHWGPLAAPRLWV